MSLALGDRFFIRPASDASACRDTIGDAEHRPILWVERRRAWVRGVLATLAAGAILGLAGYLLYPYFLDWGAWQLSTRFEARRMPAPPRESTLIGWSLIAIFASAAAVRAILPRRRIVFYADAGKTEKAFELEQTGRWQFWTERFALTDPDGMPLATLSRNRALALLQDHWTVIPTADTAITCTAHEGPIWLAPLRRLFGQAGGLLQTDLTLTTADPNHTSAPLGRLYRRHPELGRHCLDLSRDSVPTLDRRVALALGVLVNR